MKTDKTKNWTDNWKEQLDKYSVTPPPEVWEELSKELAPRRIPFRKRTIWWAAACNGSISNAKYCTLDKTGTTRYNSPIL